jgi:hypothetical protein
MLLSFLGIAYKYQYKQNVTYILYVTPYLVLHRSYREILKYLECYVDIYVLCYFLYIIVKYTVWHTHVT